MNFYIRCTFKWTFRVIGLMLLLWIRRFDVKIYCLRVEMLFLKWSIQGILWFHVLKVKIKFNRIENGFQNFKKYFISFLRHLEFSWIASFFTGVIFCIPKKIYCMPRKNLACLKKNFACLNYKKKKQNQK
jgi:hypothetical protein